MGQADADRVQAAAANPNIPACLMLADATTRL